MENASTNGKMHLQMQANSRYSNNRSETPVYYRENYHNLISFYSTACEASVHKSRCPLRVLKVAPNPKAPSDLSTNEPGLHTWDQ